MRNLLASVIGAALLGSVFCAGVGGFYLYDLHQQEQRAAATAAAEPRFRRPLVSTEGQIAFMAKKSGEGEGNLYVIGADGSGLQHLTRSTPAGRSVVGFSGRAEWLPDGKRVVMGSAGGLAIAAADGSSPAVIPNSGLADYLGPYVSPDGSRVAFVQGVRSSGHRVKQTNLFVLSLDGSHLTPVPLPSPYRVKSVAWSPDARRLAVDFGLGVHLANADGSAATSDKDLIQVDEVTASGQSIRRHVQHPAWSPDGSRLALTRGDYPAAFEVIVLDLQSRRVERPTYGRGGGERAAWSPDGTRIAFVQGDELAIMNADGSGLTVLTRFGDEDMHVASALVWRSTVGLVGTR